jgi:hypothetical protein
MSQRIIRFVPRTIRPGSFPPITPKSSPTVVALVTAVWGRLEVTRVWYQFAKRFAQQCNAAGLGCRIVVGGDQPEHRTLAAENGAEWVETPNRPLGAKWNNISEQAFKESSTTDYMLVMGSDDVMSPAMVSEYITAMKERRPYSGVQACMFYDVMENTLFNFTQMAVTVGAGRLLHRNVMMAQGYRPWIDVKEKGLDNSMDQKTLMRRVETHKIAWSMSKFILDIKSPENIWSYKRLRAVKPNEPNLDVKLLRVLPEWDAIQALKSQISLQTI